MTAGDAGRVSGGIAIKKDSLYRLLMPSQNLSPNQKAQLSKLEPLLRVYTRQGNLKEAKVVFIEIQKLLKPTEHTTRRLQNLIWLAECAIEANDIDSAKTWLENIQKKASQETRLYIEATALLGVCSLRNRNPTASKNYFREAIHKINNIKSLERRKQFHKRIVERIEDECIIYGLRMSTFDTHISTEDIERTAIPLLHLSDYELFSKFVTDSPANAFIALESIRNDAIKAIPAQECLALPSTESVKSKANLGPKIGRALKRVVWRALCDDKDEIYKAWSEGLSIVYDKKWLTGTICSSYVSWDICSKMLIATTVALAFKMGCKVFCETFAPKLILVPLSEKD